MTRRDPYGCSRPGEMLDQMPTDKARSAENRDLRHHLAKFRNMASRLLPLQSLPPPYHVYRFEGPEVALL